MKEIAVDLFGKWALELKEYWKDGPKGVAVKLGLHVVKIYPLCVGGMGCQGHIIVEYGGKTLMEAELKRGAVIWLTGAKSFSDFFEKANLAIELTRELAPAFRLLPVEYFTKPAWDLEITFFDKNYQVYVPEVAESPNKYAIKIPRFVEAARTSWWIGGKHEY